MVTPSGYLASWTPDATPAPGSPATIRHDLRGLPALLLRQQGFRRAVQAARRRSNPLAPPGLFRVVPALLSRGVRSARIVLAVRPGEFLLQCRAAGLRPLLGDEPLVGRDVGVDLVAVVVVVGQEARHLRHRGHQTDGW